jgi:hypothetical protein
MIYQTPICHHIFISLYLLNFFLINMISNHIVDFIFYFFLPLTLIHLFAFQYFYVDAHILFDVDLKFEI